MNEQIQHRDIQLRDIPIARQCIFAMSHLRDSLNAPQVLTPFWLVSVKLGKVTLVQVRISTVWNRLNVRLD